MISEVKIVDNKCVQITIYEQPIEFFTLYSRGSMPYYRVVEFNECVNLESIIYLWNKDIF